MKKHPKKLILTITFIVFISFFLITSCLPLISRKNEIIIELDNLRSEQAYSINVELKDGETVYKLEVIAECEISGKVEVHGKMFDSNTEKIILHESDFYHNRFELKVVPLLPSIGKIKVKAKFYIQR